jgi:hypothetical protein
VGVILFVYGAVHGFLDFIRDVAFTTKHAGSVMDVLTAAWNFLTTGGGNLLATVAGAGLILWALRARPRQAADVAALAVQTDTAEDAAQLKTESDEAKQGSIELGDTSRLFLTDGSRFVPDDDSERRTIFLPALLEHWAGPLSSAVEAGKTFVATGTEFDNCDIYGPGVFVLAEGSVEDTFHKCDWEEEWRAFWPATKPAHYVGVIALKNCKFGQCSFKGVSFVVKPDEYRRLYRRFTGDDL